MALSAKPGTEDEQRQPVKLSVEMSEELYDAVNQLLEDAGVPPTLDEILQRLQAEWNSAFSEALSHTTSGEKYLELGAAVVELRVIRRTTSVEPTAIPKRDELLAMAPDKRSYWMQKAAALAEDLYRNDPELTITADATELFDYPDA